MGALSAAFAGCAADRTPDARPTDRTIGYYCDRLVPSLCAYAVGTCGVAGSFEECVASAKSACCQGTCNRSARLVCAEDPCPDGAEDVIVQGCVDAYAGSASGGGGAGGTTSGLSCAAVAAGFAPDPCREKFLLLGLGTPPSDGSVE